MEALAEQLQMAEERAERAERESAYFAEMMQALAEQLNDDDAVAAIRAKVRAAHEGEAEESADGAEADR
jgi:lipid II:glycine glycyltransferase (peptidoglycan interpeptide bridge formation enzyme)